MIPLPPIFDRIVLSTADELPPLFRKTLEEQIPDPAEREAFLQWAASEMKRVEEWRLN